MENWDEKIKEENDRHASEIKALNCKKNVNYRRQSENIPACYNCYWQSHEENICRRFNFEFPETKYDSVCDEYQYHWEEFNKVPPNFRKIEFNGCLTCKHDVEVNEHYAECKYINDEPQCFDGYTCNKWEQKV